MNIQLLDQTQTGQTLSRWTQLKFPLSDLASPCNAIALRFETMRRLTINEVSERSQIKGYHYKDLL